MPNNPLDDKKAGSGLVSRKRRWEAPELTVEDTDVTEGGKIVVTAEQNRTVAPRTGPS
jgi:hypothetical protein